MVSGHWATIASLPRAGGPRQGPIVDRGSLRLDPKVLDDRPPFLGIGFPQGILRPRALAFVGVAVGSEIRLLRSRNLGVRSRVPLGVFGTDKFRPLIQGAPKRYGRRPRHRENACILNHEFDL